MVLSLILLLSKKYSFDQIHVYNKDFTGKDRVHFNYYKKYGANLFKILGMLYNTNQLVRQNLNIFKISHVHIIIQFIQTSLQIKYNNFFFFINFFTNLLQFSSSLIIFNNSINWKSKFKDYKNNLDFNMKLKGSFFITFLYYIYVFTISQDIIEIYLSSFLLLTGVLIKLIKIINYWVNNEELKKDFPIFHSIIKYTLFALLIIISVILIIIGQKLLVMVITYLKKFFLNLNIKKKFKDWKLSLDYKWFKNNGNKPNKPKETFFMDLNNSKKNKKKASYLKERVLNAQKRNLDQSSPSTTFKQQSFSEKRNIKKSINIGDRPKFTTEDQIKNVEYEFKAYDNQENKFKKIVVDINKEKEKFFPNESQSLFNEYVSVIKTLKKNLKSVEKKLSKNKK